MTTRIASIPGTHEEWIHLLKQNHGSYPRFFPMFNANRHVLDMPTDTHVDVAERFIECQAPNVVLLHFLCYALSKDASGHTIGKGRAEADFADRIAAVAKAGGIYRVLEHLGIAPGNKAIIRHANYVSSYLALLVARRSPREAASLVREIILPVYERSVLPAATGSDMSSYVAQFAEKCLKADPDLHEAKELFLANGQGLLQRRDKAQKARQDAIDRRAAAERNRILRKDQWAAPGGVALPEDPSARALLSGPFGSDAYLRQVDVSEDVLSAEIPDPARRKADSETAPVRYLGLRHWNRIILGAMRRAEGFQGMRDLAFLSGVPANRIRENVSHLVSKRMVFFGDDWYGLHPAILRQVEEHAQAGMAARATVGPEGTLLRPLAQSDHEGVIYGILSELLVCGFVISMQTSVRAVFDNAKMERALEAREYEYFKTCYLDFCVAPVGSFLPMLSIELDSSLHDNPKAKWKDDTKNKILRIGGLPSLRIRPEDYFTRDGLKQRISSALSSMRSCFLPAGGPAEALGRTTPSFR